VFQPVAVQQLQQSMNISFNAALANLGINLNVLVYARSLVAVMLGAVLAMTNVEQAPKTDAHKVVRVVAEPVAEVKANIPAELPEKAESLVNKEVIMAKLLANPGESMANLAKETGVPRSTLRYWQQKGQFPQGKPDKLRLTLDTLQDNPGITDEELARVLSISRPSAARFWRLKAKELGND